MSNSAEIKFPCPSKLHEVFSCGKRFIGAYGGRGGGKTRAFALYVAIKALIYALNNIRGVILCARQFQTSLDASSFKEIQYAIQNHPLLAQYFIIKEDSIRTKDNNVCFKFLGLERNKTLVKSMANVLLCWVDEAEDVSHESWEILLPSVRGENSQICVTWNPASERSYVNQVFRANTDPENMCFKEINYYDNPWFTKTLDIQRKMDKKNKPEAYAHVWLGEYRTHREGAYYLRNLNSAKEQGRIRSSLEFLPYKPIFAAWDLGGTGERGDHTCVWVAQIHKNDEGNKEVHIIDYYQAQGQTLETHLQTLIERGYKHAKMILPHDAKNHNYITKDTVVSVIENYGFKTQVLKKSSESPLLKVNTIRKFLDQCIFDESKTRGGIEGLRQYKEKYSPTTGVSLGPLHDEASHTADALWYLYAGIQRELRDTQPINPLYSSDWRSF